MARSNTKQKMTAAVNTASTFEGARVAPSTALEELRRTVMTCMLFEDSFYESGESAAKRMSRLSQVLPIRQVADLAIEARKQGLRHAPLWLIVGMIERPNRTTVDNDVIRETIFKVCDRVDQMGELIAQYWLDAKRPLARALKAGLRDVFVRFDEYQLTKYAARGAVRPRDVMFLTHPKPLNKAQEELWKRLANDELTSADTWEVKLSAGADKREAFTDLLTRGRLGGLALLRNLRNMEQAGVDKTLIGSALAKIDDRSRLLPFQFIAAARAAPNMEPLLEAPMLQAVSTLPKLPGKTVLLIDHSGSMSGMISGKSTLDRLDAARALAILLREICEEVVVYAFDDHVTQIPPRHGFALADAVPRARGGTNTYAAVTAANALKPDRIIIVTDEQANAAVSQPHKFGYIMNVAAYKHGIGWGKWITISGFSDQLVKFIYANENISTG